MEANIFEKTKEVPIIDIIGRYTELKRTGSFYTGLNPLRPDRHVGSFVVYPRNNYWIDFTDPDEYRGDAVNFIMKMEGCSALEACEKILSDDFRVTKSSSKKEIEDRLIQKRSPLHLDTVYRCFVNSCPTLSKEHTVHLLKERDLRESDLPNFFEYPKSTSEFWLRFHRNLKEYGITRSLRDSLYGVPGFYWDRTRQRVCFTEYDGIGIIQRDFNGLISALQVRMDKNESGMRYKLFSSGFANAKGEDHTVTGGASIGQVSDVMLCKNPKGYIITEGKFKQILLNRNGFSVLSLNGVGANTPAREFISMAKKNGFQKIIIAFDSDSREKKEVKKAALKIADMAENDLLTPMFYSWNGIYGKGIDDFLLNPDRNKGKIVLISRKEFGEI